MGTNDNDDELLQRMTIDNLNKALKNLQEFLEKLTNFLSTAQSHTAKKGGGRFMVTDASLLKLFLFLIVGFFFLFIVFFPKLVNDSILGRTIIVFVLCIASIIHKSFGLFVCLLLLLFLFYGQDILVTKYKYYDKEGFSSVSPLQLENEAEDETIKQETANTLNNNTPKQITYHVIHLNKSIDRLQNIKNNELTLNKKIEIFQAIDGTKINPYNLREFDKEVVNIFKEGQVGEIGCYLSHYLLLKQIPEDDNYTVIFEDDFSIVSDNLHDKIIKIIDELEEDNFDIVYLGNVSNNVGKKYVNNIYKVEKNNHLWGTHGYFIKNKSVKKIYNNLVVLDRPIDHKLKLLIDNGVITAYVVHPDLVLQTSSTTYSTITGR